MELDIEDALQESGHDLYNYAVLATCCMINHASCLDLLSFGVVLPLAMCDLQIGMAESGLLTSVPMAGFIFALPWGYFADTQGRRKALLISSSMGYIFAMASSLSPNWQTLLVLKFLGSCFSSAGVTLTITYLGESIVEKHRNKFMFIMNSCNLACDIVLFTFAYFILPLQIEVPISWLSVTFKPWRAYLFALALLLGLGCIMIVFLNESPKFLASIGDTERAMKVLRKIHKINKGSSKDVYPVSNLKQFEAETVVKSFWMSVIDKTVSVFTPPLLWRTVQLFYLFAICYSTYRLVHVYMVLPYSPRLAGGLASAVYWLLELPTLLPGESILKLGKDRSLLDLGKERSINVFYMWFPLFINNLFNSPFATNDQSFCERISGNMSTYNETEKTTCDVEMSEYTIFSGIFYGVVLTVLNLAMSAVAKWRRLVLICVFVISAACLVLLNLITQALVTVGLFTMVMITGIGIGNVATYFNDFYTEKNKFLLYYKNV